MTATANNTSSSVSSRRAANPPVIALVGNPNTGKTTLFNALTGFRRHVANYPGVTVELAAGPLQAASKKVELLDLPGTYSLAAVSPDEMVVCDVLAGRRVDQRRPDVILAIADASNLPRNLYIVSQVLELGLPVVVALNMVDVARSRGLAVDTAALSKKLGVPVVPVVATQDETLAPLVEALETAIGAKPAIPGVQWPEPLVAEVQSLRTAVPSLSRGDAVRALLDAEGPLATALSANSDIATHLIAARERLRSGAIEGAAFDVRTRYQWVAKSLDGVMTRPDRPVVTWSDRLDAVLTHRVGGFATLIVVLFVVFQSIFRWAAPVMSGIEWSFSQLSDAVGPLLPDGALRSLVTDGVIAGVGGVLVFLPQILILFAFVAVLEDCGYLARAAYMMDRVMRGLGLSGRAFIPLLSSFACAVPAIMGTRTIADRRERYVTILIAPFMSCSARLPVYVLMISTFVPPAAYLSGWVQLHGLVMLGMYLIGVVVAVPLAWLLKHTAFAGGASSFMLELPSYKWPRLRTVWQRMYFAGRKFVMNAGSVILLVNLLVWALGYFPRSDVTRARVESIANAEGWDADRVDHELAGEYLRESYLGKLGHAIEPAVRPLGWDWKIGMAVIASFPAREVVIGTLGTIYNLGGGEDESSESLRDALQKSTWPDSGKPVFTLPVALSLMVFFALCAQCSSTLVVIGRETGSWRWPVFSFVTMTTIAYAGAWFAGWVARLIGF